MAMSRASFWLGKAPPRRARSILTNPLSLPEGAMTALKCSPPKPAWRLSVRFMRMSRALSPSTSTSPCSTFVWPAGTVRAAKAHCGYAVEVSDAPAGRALLVDVPLPALTMVAKNQKQALAKVLVHEGGYVNHAKAPPAAPQIRGSSSGPMMRIERARSWPFAL